MALTGFDPNVVRNSMTNVIAAVDEVMDVLCHKFQTRFVDKMAELWACKDAQTFFTDSVKPAMDKLTTDTNSIFVSVVNAMKDAGNNWAKQTQASFAAPIYTSKRKELNVSSIQENINGVRGIDLSMAQTVSSSLSTISNEAEIALNKAVSAVRSCGFIGGTSASNLMASLNTIKTNIFTALTNCHTSLKQAMDATLTKYGDTEGKIAQAFAGQE